MCPCTKAKTVTHTCLDLGEWGTKMSHRSEPLLGAPAQLDADAPSSSKPAEEESGRAPLLAPRHRRRKQLLLLGASYVILFTRYTIATFLSSFFPQLAAEMGISDGVNGLIFAAYPLGMSITSIFATQAIERIGTRTATLVGLAATTLLTLLFGLAPDFMGMPSLQWVFFITYFLSGLLGALAETSCIILTSATFRDSPSAIMASISAVCTIGCMVGPPIGGVLYDAGLHWAGPAWAFRLPFMVCSAVPLLLVPFVPAAIPQRRIGEIEGASKPAASVSADAAPASAPTASDTVASASAIQSVDDAHEAAASAPASTPTAPAPKSSRKVLLSPSIILGMCSIALSGTLVATLDPTLSIRLSADPFHFSASTISLFFSYSSVIFTCVQTPCGWLVDRVDKAAPSPRRYKLITLSGFLALAATFALLAPIGGTAFGAPRGTHRADGMQRALNNVPVVATSMVLKGVGSSISQVAVYPDLIFGIPDEPLLHATISALWNGAYALGWAAGPLVGDLLMASFEHNKLCIGQSALPPHCPVEGGPPPPPPSPRLYDTLVDAAPRNCSCDWVPDNGFDGFASSMSLLALVYAVPLALAAAMNVSGPNKRYLARPDPAAAGTAPLVAGDTPGVQ